MDVAGHGKEFVAGKRRYRSVEEKWCIVEATFGTDASVAVIAQQRGINANQLFHWRKLYQSGLFNERSNKIEIDRRVCCQ